MQGGLEIPCILTLKGSKELVDKASKLLAISNAKLKAIGDDGKKSISNVKAIGDDGKK